jgi:hypothetical protein
MGYLFCGFFTTYANGLLEAAKQCWPGASVRRIHTPFEGVGLRLPEADPIDPLQYQMVVEFAEEFPAWTTNFPDLTFVYIHAECWGGDCNYLGYVCRNGIKIAEETLEEDDSISRRGALTRLLAPLGVNLEENEYFVPFTRYYPW